jgi:O-antigen biosynthesis protein WbqP
MRRSADRGALGTSAYSSTWKNAIDLFGAVALLGLFALPMLLVMTAIVLDSGRPALIQQRRIGRGEREYLMWKFRTLPRDTPQAARAELGPGLRPTRLGRFLRRYSIDELPQLINVLRGDMSLVGPRPALYTQHDLVALRRPLGAFAVKPGLTGLAQVSGREELTLEQKVAFDVEYMRHWSLRQDIVILIRTIAATLGARGSS